ncbi:PHB depolymerase family esterase [Accumulibacter sp.]|uniref:extracellular catalytic domain type 1 short-chain-length polyhydroxyalkanoate depolymerase n=1 Tax=Accumulibacter sp. TaxID=2053492 RepID=UPI0025DC9365|nr:PHB depolymerase family esterase [Accumulibacter sp.]MCM8612792.1 PHB depolymerase family esterase [Accumulibacter sp.]MCM8637558.1 PHB depolymerase family esterase [Accumulibacter sp.]MCM8639725.1 PHB depolymerase family esterase [Accumulibacter sp.]
MTNGLARYEFSERLADILGESRRDLRFRVTLMVTGGLVAPGPRGRGSPPATPQYAAQLLLGAMAAPQQSQTIEAIRCYADLRPTPIAPGGSTPRVLFGPALSAAGSEPPVCWMALEGLSFADALAALLELASADDTRALVASELFGVWVNRGCPVASLQFSSWWQGRRAVVSHNYGLSGESPPPAWLDPQRGGTADPGLFHAVFLPVRKLLEIGMLTTVTDNRSNPMLNKLGHKVASIARMAQLAAKTPHGSRWEKLLTALAAVQAWSEQVDRQESRLREVSGFGSNPGELRMYEYLPAALPPQAPLVVVLHGCTQSAASYNKGSGWSTLADRHGFALLLPQQQWNNNPLRCFNWFKPEDLERSQGEPESIRQMVEHMLASHSLDRRRIYVTGTSSGGAMTAVMLATHPDLFAGGAVIAGVPYRAAKGMQEGLETIFQGRNLAPAEWGERVRAASPHQGPWPRLSVWHGDADTAVKPVNAEELIKQWSHLHELPLQPTLEMSVNGYPRRVWLSPAGEEVIESYTITGMAHGAALDPGPAPHQCGTAAPFFNAVGISSTHRIADFWGLLAELPVQATNEAKAAAAATPADGDASAGAAAAGQASPASLASPGCAPEHAARSAPEDGHGTAGPEQGAGRRRPLGLDVHGIISASLEAAGLLKSGTTAGRAGSGAPLGIDVPGIISTALEAAGALKSVSQRAAAATTPAARLQAAGWEGDGWDLLRDDPRAFRGGSTLHGHASSGERGALGPHAHSISRRIELGPRPELSYLRRLDLSAAVNDYTSASFRILIDGIVVDEVTAIGMLHQESEWLRQSGIDLARFANRTVTLTLEVAAYSNTYSTVHASAWVEQVVIEDAVDLAPC